MGAIPFRGNGPLDSTVQKYFSQISSKNTFVLVCVMLSAVWIYFQIFLNQEISHKYASCRLPFIRKSKMLATLGHIPPAEEARVSRSSRPPCSLRPPWQQCASHTHAQGQALLVARRHCQLENISTTLSKGHFWRKPAVQCMLIWFKEPLTGRETCRQKPEDGLACHKRPGPLPNTVARTDQNPDLGFLTNTKTLFQYASTRLLTNNWPKAWFIQSTKCLITSLPIFINKDSIANFSKTKVKFQGKTWSWISQAHSLVSPSLIITEKWIKTKLKHHFSSIS